MGYSRSSLMRGRRYSPFLTFTRTLFIVAASLVLLCGPSVNAFLVPIGNDALSPSRLPGAVKMTVSQPRRHQQPINDAPIHRAKEATTMRMLSKESKDNQATNSNDERILPTFLDVGTKGGALFLGSALFVAPLLAYSIATNLLQVDDLLAGRWIGGVFTATLCVGWISTLLVRIANKDMTYAKQLKDYETAVLAKRLEELDEDEKQALLEDIEREAF